MSFTGKVGRDIETLQQNAASVAVAALRATSVPEVKRLGDVLAAHTAAHGLDWSTLAFIVRAIEPFAGPQVSRVQLALTHAREALTVADGFALSWEDTFDDRDLAYFDTGVSNVYQGARVVSQIESLAKHQPPAGSRGSRKGHG
jgi:hypothetical protein